jgi:hypothetical protein
MRFCSQAAGFRRALSQEWVPLLVGNIQKILFDTSSANHSCSPSRCSPDGFFPPFAATLSTPASVPEQLAVVWTLILSVHPEDFVGPMFAAQ